MLHQMAGYQQACMHHPVTCCAWRPVICKLWI
jgi:hypothetical protein